MKRKATTKTITSIGNRAIRHLSHAFQNCFVSIKMLPADILHLYAKLNQGNEGYEPL